MPTEQQENTQELQPNEVVETETMTEEDPVMEETATEKPNPKMAVLAMIGKRKGKEYTEIDEEALMDLSEMLTGDENELTTAREVLTVLGNIFDENPEVRQFFSILGQGGSLRSAVARSFDPEDLTPMEGDEDYEEVTGYQKERSEKKKQYKDLQAEIEKNSADSQEVIRKFAETKGVDSEKMIEFLGVIDSELASIAKGKITAEILDKFWKGSIYDGDIAEAKNEGVIEGKNMVIEPKIIEEEKTTMLPDMKSSGGGNPTGKPKMHPIQEMAETYKKNQQF